MQPVAGEQLDPPASHVPFVFVSHGTVRLNKKSFKVYIHGTAGCLGGTMEQDEVLPGLDYDLSLPELFGCIFGAVSLFPKISSASTDS